MPYLAGDQTLFRNVKKVLPGHYWKIQNGSIERTQYFDLKETFIASKDKSSFDEVVSQTQDRLKESFLLHTQSDVGYCVQLSGGVDSSYLTGILAESQPQLNTFSIETDASDYDESSFQKQMIDRYKTNHHAFMMTGKQYADQLERATYYLESPVVHSGSVFLMDLCRHISSVSKVVLTGEGADELFGGYWRHKPTMKQQLVFQLQRRGVRARWLPSISKFSTLKQILRENQIALSHCYQEKGCYHQFFTRDMKLGKQRLDYAKSVDTNYIDAVLAYDQQTYMASLLNRQDKLSMSYSVEARVPYCHQGLYRAINPILSRYKLYGGERKAILKRCTHGYLPSNLVYRRKNGLRLPLERWYRDETMVGRYLDLLTDTTARQRGIYNNQFLSKAVDAFRRGNNQHVKPLLILLNLELWHRVYNL